MEEIYEISFKLEMCARHGIYDGYIVLLPAFNILFSIVQKLRKQCDVIILLKLLWGFFSHCFNKFLTQIAGVDFWLL